MQIWVAARAQTTPGGHVKMRAMICIVLPVVERVPRERETREERLFFPVGTDWPARRRPTSESRSLLRLAIVGQAPASVPAPQPISRRYAEPHDVLCRLIPVDISTAAAATASTALRVTQAHWQARVLTEAGRGGSAGLTVTAR